MSKCDTCNNYNTRRNLCPYIGEKCLTIGKETYQMYEKADEAELSKREFYNRQKRKREINEKIAVSKCYLGMISLVVWLILSLIVSVIAYKYRFENPKLTDTELMLWIFEEYWWLYIYSFFNIFFIRWCFKG